VALKRNVVQWDDPLSRVDPRSFERLIAEYYLRRGFHVEHAGAEARELQRDGGADLRLHRGAEHIVVQCKHWRACQIMPGEVRDLYQLMSDSGATGAIMITTGEFSEAALRVARQLSVQLVDGREIRELLDRVAVQQAERKAPPSPQPLRVAAAMPARRRPGAARPYLVPAMVLAGCLIATIGLSRSLAFVRHDGADARHAAEGALRAGHDAERTVASLDGVVDASWRGAARLLVTVADASRRTAATAADACRALARAGVAPGTVVVIETPLPANAPTAIEYACPAPRGEAGNMAGATRTAYR